MTALINFQKIQERLTRARMCAFLEDLGINPDDVAEIRIYPNRMILTRYVTTDSGQRVLDHLGPKTMETYFHID